MLQSKDCHAQWVSGRVLELTGQLPLSVEGGIVLTDDSGAPTGNSFFRYLSLRSRSLIPIRTGVLLDNAQELLKMPPLTEGDLVQRFTATVNDALAYGLTSVHDAGLDPTSLDFFIRYVDLLV